MRNRLILAAAIVVIVVAALLILKSSDDKGNMSNASNNSPTDSSGNNKEANTVTMKNIEFTVKKLTVKKGTTVTWRNDDTAQHDVVFNDESMNKGKKDGLLKQGDTYKYTFSNVGTFPYHCTPHPFMKAQIEVVE